MTGMETEQRRDAAGGRQRVRRNRIGREKGLSVREIFQLAVPHLAGLALVGCAGNSAWVEEEALAEHQQSLEAVEQGLSEQREAMAAQDQALSDLTDAAKACTDQGSELLEGQTVMRNRLAQVLASLNRIQHRRERDDERSDEQSSDASSADDDRGKDSQDSTTAGFEDKPVAGAVEKVRVTPPGSVMRARIDTGANTSSLDARDVRYFERDGEDWVRFKVYDRDTDTTTEHERPVARRVRIVSATEQDDSRPVVELRVEIGPVVTRSEFTLADRQKLTYPVLIGRNLLRDRMLVDVARERLLDQPEPDAGDDAETDADDSDEGGK